MKKLVQVCAILTLTAGYAIQAAAPARAAAGRCEEVKFTKANYQVNETDGQVAVTIKREVSPLGCPGQLEYWTDDITATAPNDYAKTSDDPIITSEESFTFTIPIVNDVLLEGPEKFKVSLVFNGAVGAQDTAIVTIADNRQPTSPPPPAPPPPSTSGTTSSTSSSSSTGSASATTKTTRPRASSAVASPSPVPPTEEQPAAELPPAIEESSESTQTKVRPLTFARPRASAESNKKLWAFLTVVLVAAAGVILVAWRQRENSKQNFSTLAS